jgi:precorrin-3B synthase
VSNSARERVDRCPGALRPWPAEDGLLIRLRLVGGRVTSSALRSLVALAEEYGDGRLHLTRRANLQVRGLPGVDEVLDPTVLAALEATGLLPTRTHELVRNIMVSPQTGLGGGRADLRHVAVELDRALCARTQLSGLPGRFLFVLDDGRGDLLGRECDLGLVALDDRTGQLRIGPGWGPVAPLADTAAALAALAVEFAERRGSGPTAPWHIVELPEPLAQPVPADPRLPSPTGPPAYGAIPGGEHVPAPGGVLDRAGVERLTAGVPEVVVTPWRGVLVPEEAR